MDDARARQLAEALVAGADELHEIARTAGRNKKALSGSGFYADRFHGALIKLTSVENQIMPVIDAIAGFDSGGLRKHLQTAKAVTGDLRGRDDARKQIRLICQTQLLPQLGNLSAPASPRAEPVLPASVCAKAP